MKIVINSDYGGFGLSVDTVLNYAKRKNLSLYFYEYAMTEETSFYNKVDAAKARDAFQLFYLTEEIGERIDADDFYGLAEDFIFHVREISRTDPDLIAAIEEVGVEAADRYAKLKIIEIPDDVDYVIQEYDGAEWVAERHRTWS